MSSTVFDSELFRDMFGTAEMRGVFSDAGYLARCLEVEAALARAQAREGVIPDSAAREITASADIAFLDMALLKRETEIVGYPILPLVKQLAATCAGEAGGYVHWGATTQDIMDTAVVLQLRAALELLESDLDEILASLETLARRYRERLLDPRNYLGSAAAMVDLSLRRSRLTMIR